MRGERGLGRPGAGGRAGCKGGSNPGNPGPRGPLPGPQGGWLQGTLSSQTGGEQRDRRDHDRSLLESVVQEVAALWRHSAILVDLILWKT